MLAIANSLRRSSAMVNLKYDFKCINMENFILDEAEIFGNVVNSLNNTWILGNVFKQWDSVSKTVGGLLSLYFHWNLHVCDSALTHLVLELSLYIIS